MDKKDEMLKKYPKTDKFEIVDTIAVPHPYCITAKHVQVASDHYSGILGEAAIEGAEKEGARCDICRQNGQTLTYKMHKTALLVCVNDPGKELAEIEGLKEYLLSIKEMAEKDDMAGFAFVRKEEYGGRA